VLFELGFKIAILTSHYIITGHYEKVEMQTEMTSECRRQKRAMDT
jgi:hypothetical protein